MVDTEREMAIWARVREAKNVRNNAASSNPMGQMVRRG